ncbi:hypothetical protein COLO4_23207 [Corchorus olitorius]|uniref:RNase H type-1 domain-containing protein n=1 Tax=Corchorus olitorius TaxID=93759 RepID=A0A1R3IHV8_9ROSI|nr:hypothetical protein COLO4_23207 [Corchorus olitorius]
MDGKVSTKSSEGAGRNTKRPLFIERTAAMVAGRRATTTLSGKELVNKDTIFSGFRDQRKEEIVGDNLAGLVDRERERFGAKLTVSDQVGNKGRRTSWDLIESESPYLRREEGEVNREFARAASKKTNVDYVDLGQSLGPHGGVRREISPLAKSHTKHDMQAQSAGLDRGNPNVDCFNFQATKHIVDVEVSSVSRHSATSKNVSRRKKLLPKRICTGERAKQKAGCLLEKELDKRRNIIEAFNKELTMLVRMMNGNVERQKQYSRGKDALLPGSGFFGDLRWRELYMVTVWAIWNDRNTEFHEGKKRSPQQTVDFIRSYLLEYQRCQQAVSISLSLHDTTHWRKPQRGFVKINFDGSYLAVMNQGSFGALARDEDGQVLGAIAGQIVMVADAFSAECLAAIKAVNWAKDMGFRQVEIEGDALSIIRKVNAVVPDFSPIGPYIADLKFLSSLFISCIFLHVRRDGNAVAHALTSLGASLLKEKIWMEEVSDSVMAALQLDCNALPH